MISPGKTPAPPQAARRPVFRFAPSPNGLLHVGHAYSALLNARIAEAASGAVLLRLEDTDVTRCTTEFAKAIEDDLVWLGLKFDAAPRRQSEHWGDYAEAIGTLDAMGLVFPCACTRGQMARRDLASRDPDGAPLHRGRCTPQSRAGEPIALRLDIALATQRGGARVSWMEYEEGEKGRRIEADPTEWGDVVLRGKERPATYHLAVVVDDAIQGVTDIVRGRDLYASTSIHRLLQTLLGQDAPRYRHHRLVRDAEGAKMSKSAQSLALRTLRERGVSADEIRAALGFDDRARSALAFEIS
jgi:glutamyl-Q tRNA(Asp) synthetase